MPEAPPTQPMPLMCHACGQHLTPEAVKCPSCGAPAPGKKGARRVDATKVAGFLLVSLAILGGVGAYIMLADRDAVGGEAFLGRSYIVSGTVGDANGTALADVAVLLDAQEGNATTANTTRTDANGTFLLRGVSTGGHALRFQKDGFERVDLRVFLFQDRVVDVRMASGNATVVRNDATYNTWSQAMNVCGSIILAVALLCVAGAVACYRQRNYGLALTASIFSLVAALAFLPGILLSAIAIALVVRNRKNFR